MGNATPTFRTTVSSIERDEVIIPILRAHLYDPDFPSFKVHVEGFSTRPPDGWFHPSEHPLWTERMLYYYLTEPERLIAEVMDPLSTMAVTAGSFWHSFTQIVMVRKAKILVRQPEVCGCGHKHRERAEVYLEDGESRTRGHTDGILIPEHPFNGDGFEFKTGHPAKVAKQGTLETFIDTCPDYYLQVQEYMRLSGLAGYRVLFVSPSYPFEMREVRVPYDPTVALGIRDKYLRAIEAARLGDPPSACCNPRSKMAKECPARVVCPIGRM